MIILQGNTYLLPIQVGDCNDNVITADRVAKGQFIFGKYEKFYGEEGEVQWSDELQAFLFPLTEQETFELNGVIKYQARLLLNDGSVSGSVPENYYVYESITKSIISNGEVGQESGNLLKVKLVMPVVNEGGAGGSNDYNKFENKPSINGVILEGNKTTEELGIVSKETDPTVPDFVKNIREEDIESWNNKATTDYVDEKVDDVREVAEGKTKSFTVTYLSDLGTLLGIDTSVVSNEYAITSTTITYKEKVYELKQGDLFLIVDTNVPDYWVSVDDMKIYKMETTKVDLTDYVKNTDYATASNVGVGKFPAWSGLGTTPSGDVFVNSASDTQILAKTESYFPISAKKIDLAVKVGVTTNKITLTDEEKAAAQDWLGIGASAGGVTQLVGTAEKPINLATDMEVGKWYSITGRITSAKGNYYNVSNGESVVFKCDSTHILAFNTKVDSTNWTAFKDGFWSSVYFDENGYKKNVFSSHPVSMINNNTTAISSIFAPISGGTSGYLLRSNGSYSAPTWVKPSTIIPQISATQLEDGSYSLTITEV